MAPALNPKPPMSVRLPCDLRKRLDAHAEAAGITPHAAAVLAITLGLAWLENEGPTHAPSGDEQETW
jgi:hypothetical protein